MSCGRSPNTNMGPRCPKEVFRWGSCDKSPLALLPQKCLPSHIQTQRIAYFTLFHGRTQAINLQDRRVGRLILWDLFESQVVIGIQFKNDSLLPNQLTSRLGTALLELWDGPRMPPGIPSEQNQDETCWLLLFLYYIWEFDNIKWNNMNLIYNI